MTYTYLAKSSEAASLIRSLVIYTQVIPGT